MSDIIQSIKRFAGLSTDRLINQQSAYIPTLNNDFVECIGYRYILNGIEYRSSDTGDIIIKIKEDYIKSINKPIPIGEYKLEELLQSKTLPLFILFIDGIFIPYDVLKFIVDDYRNMYIKLTNHMIASPTNIEIVDVYLTLVNIETNIFIDTGISLLREDYFANLLKEDSYVQTIIPTGDISYNVSASIPSNAIYSFEKYGKFSFDTEDLDIKYIFSANIPKNYYKRIDSATTIKNMEVLDDEALKDYGEIKLSDKNVMLFIDGLLRSGTPQSLARSNRYERVVNGSYCQYDGMAYNIVTATNPSVEFKTSLLTIDDGNELGDDVQCIISINPHSDRSIDNVYKVDEQYVKDNIVSQTPVSDTILEDFNPNVSTINDMVEYIMQYNPAILNDIVKQSTNISIEKISYSDEKVIPVSHKHSEDKILIFVDGELYGLDYMTYKHGKCIVDMTHIANKDTTIIELMRFSDIDNNHGIIHSANSNDNSSGWFNNLDNIINAQTELFSSEANNSDYTYPSNGMQMFKVGYSLEYNPETGLTRIIADDEFYNDKDLYYYSKNRFVSLTVSYTGNSDAEYFEIDLGADDRFRGCYDYYKFMVFINGIRLMWDKYRLVLPVRQTTPFYEARLYLSVPFKTGDVVTVIYAPNILYDMPASINTDTGDISVIGVGGVTGTTSSFNFNRTPCNYQISKNLNMIWINGKKVPDDYIVDIGFNKLHINTDMKSIKSVYISKYIEDLDILNGLLSTSKWDTAVVDNENKNNMLNISDTSMSDIEEDSYAGSTDIEAIMNEIIRDQFVSKVDVTIPFTYGYDDIDTSVIKGEDSDGNGTIETMDANEKHSISLSDVDRKLI